MDTEADKPLRDIAKKTEGSVEKPDISGPAAVAAFVAKAKVLGPIRKDGGRGRLVFALDATMSRQPTWDTACQLQAEMFSETNRIGGLDVQLVYFRGFGECRASRWVRDSEQLAGLMGDIYCRGGHTQIGKILAHVSRETATRKVDALVYVGDCLEEDIDGICAKAGKLGLQGVPVFAFQEGFDRRAEQGFREIARLTKGAFCRFDAGSRDQLRALLSAVAVYAAGGRMALGDMGKNNNSARILLEQMK